MSAKVFAFRTPEVPTDFASLQSKVECYQRVTREWLPSLTSIEVTVLLQVIDRTIGWGVREAHFTAKRLHEGDKMYCGMAQMMSRATMFRALASLGELDIVRRRADPNNPRKVYYSVNMGWEPDMLNVPKRLRNGEDSRTGETMPVSRVRLSQSHGCDTSYSNPGTGIPETVSSGAASPCPVPNPAEKVREALSTAVAAHRVVAAGRAAAKSGSTTSVPVEAAWKAAMLDAFPGSIHKPWSIREKAQVKGQVRSWLHTTEIAFPAFVDWAVRNWSAIIAKQFGWMTKSPPPQVPSLSFLLSFLGQFAECWSERKLEDWLMDAERTELEKLTAGGLPHEEALAEIGRRRATEGMKDENEKVRIEARGRLRRAEAAERRVELSGTAPIHPRSRAAQRLREAEAPTVPARPVDADVEIDWNNVPTLDPNWEPGQ